MVAFNYISVLRENCSPAEDCGEELCPCTQLDARLHGREVEVNIFSPLSNPGGFNCSTGCDSLLGPYLLTFDKDELVTIANCETGLNLACQINTEPLEVTDSTCNGVTRSDFWVACRVFVQSNGNYGMTVAFGPSGFGGNNWCYTTSNNSLVESFLNGNEIEIPANIEQVISGCDTTNSSVKVQLA